VSVYVPGRTLLTVPLVEFEIVLEPSTISYTDAHCSANDEPASIVIVDAPLRVTFGAVVSMTVTVLERVFEVLFDESTFLYCTIYVHGTCIFTEPEYAITEPLPSTISVHRAPGSTYEPVEASTVCEADPERLRTGGVVSMIVTVRFNEPVFHELSAFAYVRVYVPGTFIFTEPEVARGIEPDQETISVHRAPGSEYVPVDACKV